MIFKKTLINAILILGMTHPTTQLLGSLRNQPSLTQAMSNFTTKLRNLTQTISQGQSIKQSAAQQHNPPAPVQQSKTYPIQPIATPQIQQQRQQRPTLFLQKMSLIDKAIGGWMDTIVNAANSMLHSGGGLSGEIFQAAGKEILNNEIKNNTHLTLPLKTTENAVTSAGALKEYNIQTIIHAVGPDFRTRKNPKELLPLVKDTYKNIFKTAKEIKSIKIGLPPISAGIYLGNTLPLSDVALQTALAFKEFLESGQTGSIRTIYLCLFTDDEFKTYVKAFNDVGLSFFETTN